VGSHTVLVRTICAGRQLEWRDDRFALCDRRETAFERVGCFHQCASPRTWAAKGPGQRYGSRTPDRTDRRTRSSHALQGTTSCVRRNSSGDPGFRARSDSGAAAFGGRFAASLRCDGTFGTRNDSCFALRARGHPNRGGSFAARDGPSIDFSTQKLANRRCFPCFARNPHYSKTGGGGRSRLLERPALRDLTARP